MPPQSDGTRGFWFRGIVFGSGQPTAAAGGAAARGVGRLGDLIRCARRAQERPFGAVERRDEYYALFVFVGGAVAVCFEGCCGSMCWPVDRPATHAAAGAAARGALIFCFGDCFTCSELGNDTMTIGGGVVVCSEGRCGGEGLTTGVVRHACRHRVTARGVFGLGGLFHTPGSGQPTAAAGGAAARGVRGIGGFNPLRGAGAGAPIRRRHAAGATRRVLCAFWFCGGRCCRLF